MNIKRGINLGGFLSQCDHDPVHYQTFIVKKDIERIASWGLDHVRLPIDYEVFETEEGEEKPEGLLKVKEVVSWCLDSHLSIILDLHKAYGYDFNDAGNGEKNNLFQNEALQERFIRLWKRIAACFAGQEDVAFELLNEVVETENADAWNALIKKTVRAIRSVAKDNLIIYGGIMWNSADTVRLLETPEDKNILFTFHFYEPLLFTHQKAHWVKTIDPSWTIPYPGNGDFYREKSSQIGDQGIAVSCRHYDAYTTAFMEEMIMGAIKAAKEKGVGLYCGEFGVIDQAPAEDTLRWFKDVNEVFAKYDIGFAAWNYKEKDFGIEGAHYDSIRDELLALWNVS